MAATMALTTGVVYVRSISGTLVTGAITASGNLLFSPDNTYNIGNGATADPAHVYAATSLRTRSYIHIAAAANIFAPNDGTLQITNNAQTGFSHLQLGSAGGATSTDRLQKKVTAIADNTATTVFTVTVPNANHAASIKLRFLSSNGSTDAFESSRTAEGTVVLARTSGVDTVATAVAISDAAIATVAAGATHTLAYSVTAMSGLSSATQTFDIQVTIDDLGNLGSNQVVAVAEVLNAEATGVTIA